MEVERLNGTFPWCFHQCYTECFGRVSTAVRWVNSIIFFLQISKIKEEMFNLTMHPEAAPRNS